MGRRQARIARAARRRDHRARRPPRPRRPSRARRAPARLRPGVGGGDRQARRRAAGAGRRRRGAWGRAHPGAPPPSASRLRCLARRLAAHRAPARLARWLACLGDRDQPPGRRPRHGAAARPVSRGGHRDERCSRPTTGRHRDRPAGRSRRLAAAGGGGSRGPHPPCPRRGARACPRRCTRCGCGASRGRCRPRPGGATWPPRRTRAPDRFDPSSAARSSTPSCSVRPPGPRHRLPSGCRRRSARPRPAGAAASSGSTSASASRSRGSQPAAAEALLWRLVHVTAELDDGRQAIRWSIRRGRAAERPRRGSRTGSSPSCGRCPTPPSTRPGSLARARSVPRHRCRPTASAWCSGRAAVEPWCCPPTPSPAISRCSARRDRARARSCSTSCSRWRNRRSGPRSSIPTAI